VTKETLKYILYEGAKTNGILRINDHCFEQMIETLNLPLDKQQMPKSNMSHDAVNRYQIDDEEIHISNPNEQSVHNKEDFEELESKGNSIESSDFFDIDYQNKNQFLLAKDALLNIIQFEEEHPDLQKPQKSDTKSKSKGEVKLYYF
jgi:hypothetical protein